MNVRTVSRSWQAPLSAALVIGCGLLAPGLARAESDNEAAETAAARALAVDGVKLAQAGQCDAAVEKLDRAQRLKHSPIVLRYLGECQVTLGRWVEGSESFRKLLRDPMPDQPTPAIEQAYEVAAAGLKEVGPKIPTMTVKVDAPPDTDLALKVDGKLMADSVIGVALPANPGEHQVEVTATGFLPAKSSIDLEPSGNAVVTLELSRDPSFKPTVAAAPAAAAQSERTTYVEPARASRESGSKTGKVFGWVSYGVAAVGLGTGIVLGQMAMKEEDELRAACPGHVCPPDQQDALNAAKAKGNFATIGFAVAGAGLTFGTILLVTSSGSDSKSGAATKQRVALNRMRPRALVGPTSVTLAADF
jgi:hypothetical protein